MKTIAKAIAIILLVAIAFIGMREYCARYTMRYCEVYDVNDYEIAIIDNSDDIWVWREYTKGVEIGDNCRLKMHTNYTDEDRTDDYIIEIIWVD